VGSFGTSGWVDGSLELLNIIGLEAVLSIERFMKKITQLALASVLAAGLTLPAMAEEEELREIVMRQDAANPLAFAEKAFTVKAGEKIKLTLDNEKAAIPQPHNVLVIKPGSLAEVQAAAMAAMTDATYMTDGCVPESDNILHIIKLVQPGQKDSVEFEAPAEAGDYPFVCTFPGHWTMMHGILTVEE